MEPGNCEIDDKEFKFMSPSDNSKFKILLDDLLHSGLHIADHLQDFSLDALEEEPFFGEEKDSYPWALKFFGLIHYVRRFRELNKDSGFPVREKSFVILVNGCKQWAERFVKCHVDDKRCKWGPLDKAKVTEFISIAKRLEDLCRSDALLYTKFRDPINPELGTPDNVSTPGRKTSPVANRKYTYLPTKEDVRYPE